MSTPLGIQPDGRRRGGLESIERPLVGPRGGVLGEDEWRGGVIFTSPGDDAPFVWPTGCATPLADAKDIPEGIEAGVTFRPVVTGAGRGCLPGRSVIGDLVRDLAIRDLELRRYELLARAMFDGARGATPGSENPGLLNLTGAVVAPGIDPTAPPRTRLAFQALLNTMCQYGGADWVVHAPLPSLPVVKDQLGLAWDADRGVWTLGDIDFSFECTQNEGPSDIEGVTPTATDGSEIWLWMTRRPMVAWSDSSDIIDGLDTNTNRRKVVAERVGMVVVDQVAVGATKARTV